MENSTDKEKHLAQHNVAHAGSRSGLSDYNDGANVTHYLGNDKNRKGDLSKQDEFEKVENVNIGKVAEGNDLEEETEKEH